MDVALRITRRQAIATLSLSVGGFAIAGDSLLGQHSPTTRLGLDLQGGSYLLLEVDTSQGEVDTSDGQSIEDMKELVRRHFGDIVERATIVPMKGK